MEIRISTHVEYIPWSWPMKTTRIQHLTTSRKGRPVVSWPTAISMFCRYPLKSRVYLICSPWCIDSDPFPAKFDFLNSFRGHFPPETIFERAHFSLPPWRNVRKYWPHRCRKQITLWHQIQRINQKTRGSQYHLDTIIFPLYSHYIPSNGVITMIFPSYSNIPIVYTSDYSHGHNTRHDYSDCNPVRVSYCHCIPVIFH